MRQVRWLTLGLLAALLISLSSTVWADSLYSPQRDGTYPTGGWAVTGNQWMQNYPLFKQGYIAGFADGVRTIVAHGSRPRERFLTRLFAGAGITFPEDDTDQGSAFLTINDLAQSTGSTRFVWFASMGSSNYDAWYALSFPAGSTWDQLVAIVDKYIEDHPEQRHYEASFLVWTALAEAFHPLP